MSWRLPCNICGSEDEVFNRQSLLCTGCLYTAGGAYWDALNLEDQTKLLLRIHKKKTLQEMAVQIICQPQSGGKEKFCEKCGKHTPHCSLFDECMSCERELELKALLARPAQQIVDILFDKTSKDHIAPYIKVGIASVRVLEKYGMMPTPEYIEMYKNTDIYKHLEPKN